MNTKNELYDRVDEIIKEHGILTGQEFLDLTNTECGGPLHMAYITFFDSIIMPDVLENIDRKIKKLDG